MIRLAALPLALAALASPFVGGEAHAQTCSTSVTQLNYGVAATPTPTIDSSATLTVSCTSVPTGRSVRICVSMVDPSIPMQSGLNQLAENIYSDSTRTKLFGSFLTSSTGGVQVDFTASSSSFGVNVPLYGRVPSGQSKPPGTYTVTMAATNLKTAVQITNGNIRSCAVNAGCPSGVLCYDTALTALATLQGACSVSASTMSFPTVGFLNTAQDGSSSMAVTCSAGTPYTVALSGGTSNATDPTQRKMTSGTGAITYGLYRDVARSQPWGATAATRLSQTGTGSSQSIPVYGRVPVQPTPAPGNYSDTVVVTVSY